MRSPSPRLTSRVVSVPADGGLANTTPASTACWHIPKLPPAMLATWVPCEPPVVLGNPAGQ